MFFSGKDKNSSAKTENFWKWFLKEKGQFENINVGDVRSIQQQLQTLLAQLKKIDQHLEVELGKNEAGQNDLVISAGGIKAAFDQVNAVVAAAPIIEGWVVTAFKQPKPTHILQFPLGEKIITQEDMWFTIYGGDASEINVIIVLKSGMELSEDVALQIGFTSLDAAIGEYDVTTKIAEINCFNFPPDQEWTGYIKASDENGSPMQMDLMPFSVFKQEFEKNYNHREKKEPR